MLFSEEELVVSPANNPYLSCEKCGLFRGCQTPYMKAAGLGKKKILLIGEAPGAQEDRSGIPFVGKAGSALDAALSKVGINMDRDCIRTNACICRPPGNSTPTKTQIDQCRKFLFEVIEKHKPEKIITLGGPALESLIGLREKVGAVSQWVGFAIPDQTLKAWVFPTFHPSYVLREDENNAATRVWWMKHLQQAADHSSTFYEHNYRSDVHVIRDLDKAAEEIRGMMNAEEVAFDYETTGLKPYNRGHKILSASMSDGFYAISFLFRKELWDLWREFLRSPIRKVAHNLKFEEVWSRTILGTPVENWVWDTMIAAHIIDNRPGITSLKSQAYLNLGVAGYEDEIKPYMVSKDGANGFNRLEEFPQKQLLQYGGEDALYTAKLKEIQQGVIESGYPEAFDLFMRSTKNFADFEETGVRASREYYEEAKRTAETQMDVVMKKIVEDDRVWEGFSPTKPSDVASLIYDVMMKPTPDGTRTTKASFLETIDDKLVKAILEYRKWKTASGTFVDGFLREISEDEILHCGFSLNTVRSFRSSSSNPNFQNIPKRDTDIMKLIRGGLFPHVGQELWEYDFKSVEVCISACYHRDPAMISYILDPSTDMHRDQAIEIFFRSKEDYENPEMKKLLKDERYLAKNGFVFPQFYGDYYVSCAESMWERMGKESKKHLRENGIRNLADFTMHMEAVETKFWKRKFAVYDAWKTENWNKYQRRGVIDFYTGFRAQGVMRENQVNNLAIQGTAFHVLLETVDYVKSRIKNWKSRMMGQIHDSSIVSQEIEETELIHGVFAKALGHIQDMWSSWLVVPLVIETEKAEVDRPWSEIEEVGRIEAS